ncbi:hypothetical protein QBC44DRAFT_358106 [Cladorrhinum sp. PSN332]|nr:hypothetical protein QBC44DRAFT_358106 [Cladorrhinum sp. PSN332]
MTCKQAEKDGLLYAWIDTCCIDKASSAELSEAINSMFKWYRQAVICYAYLADVSDVGDDDHHEASDSSFSASKWFTRGWTLQELIAPVKLRFFDSKWKRIGDKQTLESAIHIITRIDVEVLRGGNLKDVSVARRMSWASDRQTTREEDIAYCLMGIFDINMPMLYGEGKKAFIRLQEEILKEIGDESMFAWKAADDSLALYRGMFADSPSEFKDSFDIVTIWDTTVRPAPSVSSKGVAVALQCKVESRQAHPLTEAETIMIAKAGLGCCMRGDNLRTLAIELTHIMGESQRFRSSPSKLFQVGPLVAAETMTYLPKSAHEVTLPTVTSSTRTERVNGFFFDEFPAGISVDRLIPSQVSWNHRERTIYWSSLVDGCAGMVLSSPALVDRSQRILIVMWAHPDDRWINRQCFATAKLAYFDQVDDVYRATSQDRSRLPVNPGRRTTALPVSDTEQVTFTFGYGKVQCVSMYVINSTNEPIVLPPIVINPSTSALPQLTHEEPVEPSQSIAEGITSKETQRP